MDSQNSSESLKFLVIGDPHFQNKNVPDATLASKKVLEILEKRKDLSFLVILGDVLHRHSIIEQEAQNMAYEFISECGKRIYTYVLVGNHDMKNNSQYQPDKHSLSTFVNLPNVKIVDKVFMSSIGNFLFTFCPYVYPGRFEEMLNSSGYDWKSSSCIFAHQEFKGCELSGTLVSTKGDDWSEENPQVISGHIHKFSVMKNIFYPGSWFSHNFGEMENKAVGVITLMKNENFDVETMYETFDLGIFPRKKILCTPETCSALWLELGEYPADKVRFVVKGTVEELKVFRSENIYLALKNAGYSFAWNPVVPKVESVKNYVSFSEILRSLIKEENPLIQKLFEEIIV